MSASRMRFSIFEHFSCHNWVSELRHAIKISRHGWVFLRGGGGNVLFNKLRKLNILEAFGYDNFLTFLESAWQKQSKIYFQLKQHIGLRKSEFF